MRGMSVLSIVRTIAIFLIVGIFSAKFIRSKFAAKENQEELEEIVKNYEKDENGLYPWEKDQDDSPNRVAKEAKRYTYDAGRPKRGKW